MPKFNPLEASFKLIAVCAIFTTWTKLTIEAFNFAWHIVSTSRGEETLKVVRKAVCEKCGNVYDDDEFDVIIGRCICFDCRV